MFTSHISSSLLNHYTALVSVIITAFLLVFSACISSQDRSTVFIGKWKSIDGDDSIIWEFKEKGVFCYAKNSETITCDRETSWHMKEDGTVIIKSPEGEYFARIDKRSTLIGTDPSSYMDSEATFTRIK